MKSRRLTGAPFFSPSSSWTSRDPNTRIPQLKLSSNLRINPKGFNSSGGGAHHTIPRLPYFMSEVLGDIFPRSSKLVFWTYLFTLVLTPGDYSIPAGEPGPTAPLSKWSCSYRVYVLRNGRAGMNTTYLQNPMKRTRPILLDQMLFKTLSAHRTIWRGHLKKILGSRPKKTNLPPHPLKLRPMYFLPSLPRD